MKLPPLHALMCFEAAGRLMSMKKAAEELHVTPAAVSQQIAKLEERVQARLFIRSHRQLALTREGQIYLQAIRPAFTLIDAATERLCSESQQRSITVSCTSGFAMQWLLPRLPRFEKICPGIDIQLNTTNRKVDLLAEGVDFAIRHGLGHYPGLEVEKLVSDDLCPVCSPALLAKHGALGAPAAVLSFTLLHDEHKQDWALWLQSAGVETAPHLPGPVFVDSNGAIDAALAGKGIALIRTALVRQELAAGRLINPLRLPLASITAYYLVYDASALLQRANQRFRRWLAAEAAAEGNIWAK